MEIVYTDDGKGKYQSHEAVVSFAGNSSGEYHIDCYLHAYGKDKVEAQESILAALTALRTKIDEAIKTLPATT